MLRVRQAIRCKWLRPFGLAALAFTVASFCVLPRAVAQRALAFEHEREMYVSSWHHLPVWSGRLLLRLEDNLTSGPLVDAVDRDLNHDAISFEIPGANLINIRGLGGGADGSILVGGNAFSGDSRRAGFIALISPDRKRRTLIQTEPFRPEGVALAADGTIWAVGLVFDGKEGRQNTHNVIQRYDASGKMLSSMQVPKAKAFPNDPLIADANSDLMASKDRVGWLTNGCEYVESSLDGTILARFDGPAEDVLDLRGVALSDANDVLVAKAIGDRTVFLTLDRAARSWVPVPMRGRDRPGAQARVFGFDGTTLVVEKERGILSRFKLAVGPGL